MFSLLWIKICYETLNRIHFSVVKNKGMVGCSKQIKSHELSCSIFSPVSVSWCILCFYYWLLYKFVSSFYNAVVLRHLLSFHHCIFATICFNWTPNICNKGFWFDFDFDHIQPNWSVNSHNCSVGFKVCESHKDDIPILYTWHNNSSAQIKRNSDDFLWHAIRFSVCWQS